MEIAKGSSLEVAWSDLYHDTCLTSPGPYARCRVLVGPKRHGDDRCTVSEFLTVTSSMSKFEVESYMSRNNTRALATTSVRGWAILKLAAL